MWLSYVLAALSLIRTILNIKKIRICFFIWTFTNFSWMVVDIYFKIYAQALLFGVYFGLALWKIYAW